MKELTTAAVELSSTISRSWNAFFFSPSDPTPLGLIRIAMGILMLWSMGVYGLDLQAFFGSTGWQSTADLLKIHELQESNARWSFWFFVGDAWLRPVWVVCIMILVLFTLGLWSRLTAVLAWVIVVSTVRRAEASTFGYDQIATTWALYLAVTGASGQALSIDRFLARYRLARAGSSRRRQDGRWNLPSGAPAPSISANLALRLIQLHLALIYGSAGLSKLQGEPWWNGMAIWGLLACPEFNGINLTWLAGYPWLLNVLTHGTVFLETAYPVLIWVKPLRPLFLAAIVGLHIGIGVSAPGLIIFSAAMLVGNVAFVSGPWLRSLVTGLIQPAGRVLYDGACPRCRATMALVTAADADHVVEPVDLTAVDVRTIHPSLTKDACMRSMHLVRADGRVFAGYDAVITLLRWHPLCWPIALAGSLPGVAGLGRRLYAAIAASRPRDVPCTDDTCGIHPPRGERAGPTTVGADSKRTHP
jgi:predicted DCC family thiol-disulfide oxidoreductase YuxK